MRTVDVYVNDTLAGILSSVTPDEFVFKYVDKYYHDDSLFPISVTFPKTQQEYHSTTLFAFFFGLLAEGSNKERICRSLKIDENDHFGLLLALAGTETIGAVTIRKSRL